MQQGFATFVSRPVTLPSGPAPVVRAAAAVSAAAVTVAVPARAFTAPAYKATVESTLLAVSPIDGRYNAGTSPALSPLFSEFALIKNRALVEVRWLQHLSASGVFPELPALSANATAILDEIIANFSVQDAARVKEIERTTRHDVKAVEYFLKEKVAGDAELKQKVEFMHFACTSEDISNLSYSLMLHEARDTVLLPKMTAIIDALTAMAVDNAAVPMLARTHGQPATPTTLGKELGNFAVRLAKQRKLVKYAFFCFPIFRYFPLMCPFRLSRCLTC
jgi:adenylosuccinate lyase